MGLEIRDLKRPATGAMYVSPARICVTADGALVDEDDQRAVRLLVAAGGELPVEEARRYGLVEDAPEPEEETPDPDAPSAPAQPKAPRKPARGQ